MSITKNLNLAVLGPKNVGKTTILKKYCTNSYIKTTKGFDSQLVSIGDYAFDFCSFNQFYVPQLIESLPSNLFYKNRDLKIIEIAENTILKMSRNYFRIPSNITWIIVLIPPKVSKRMISNSSAISSFDYLH